MKREGWGVERGGSNGSLDWHEHQKASVLVEGGGEVGAPLGGLVGVSTPHFPFCLI